MTSFCWARGVVGEYKDVANNHDSVLSTRGRSGPVNVVVFLPDSNTLALVFDDETRYLS